MAFAFLYSLGGRSNKWLRRYLGTFILTLTMCGLAYWRGIFHWSLLLVWPILIIGTSKGYSGTSLSEKIIKRTLCALSILASGVPFLVLYGSNCWWVAIPHVGVGLFSIYLGVKNPVEAAFEEFWIAMLLSLGLLGYVFVSQPILRWGAF